MAGNRLPKKKSLRLKNIVSIGSASNANPASLDNQIKFQAGQSFQRKKRKAEIKMNVDPVNHLTLYS